MTIRSALPEDAPMLADLHVRAWAETYPGLLPRSEIARFDRAFRLKQWRHQLAADGSRIVIAPGLGFAQIGPQRDAALARQGYADEFYALYLLREAQGCGVGRALFAAALGASPQPLSALVVDGNQRACDFYHRSGARHAETRSEWIDGTEIRDRLYLWDVAPGP